jgi:hypothetical protein
MQQKADNYAGFGIASYEDKKLGENEQEEISFSSSEGNHIDAKEIDDDNFSPEKSKKERPLNIEIVIR